MLRGCEFLHLGLGASLGRGEVVHAGLGPLLRGGELFEPFVGVRLYLRDALECCVDAVEAFIYLERALCRFLSFD